LRGRRAWPSPAVFEVDDAHGQHMLVYIFWHLPSDRSKSAEYERQLLRFHTALAGANIEGFTGSQSARVTGIPWVPGDNGYEDWYLLADSGCLDRINNAAVTVAKAPHDQLAVAADWGAGGLYRRRFGQHGIDAAHALWFAKPTDMTYAQLDALVQRLLPPSGSLWQRQMVLGPGHEYCILVSERLELPPSLDATCVAREPVRRTSVATDSLS
jgi:hypothetical protein